MSDIYQPRNKSRHRVRFFVHTQLLIPRISTTTPSFSPSVLNACLLGPSFCAPPAGAADRPQLAYQSISCWLAAISSKLAPRRATEAASSLVDCPPSRYSEILALIILSDVEKSCDYSKIWGDYFACCVSDECFQVGDIGSEILRSNEEGLICGNVGHHRFDFPYMEYYSYIANTLFLKIGCRLSSRLSLSSRANHHRVSVYTFRSFYTSPLVHSM